MLAVPQTIPEPFEKDPSLSISQQISLQTGLPNTISRIIMFLGNGHQNPSAKTIEHILNFPSSIVESHLNEKQKHWYRHVKCRLGEFKKVVEERENRKRRREGLMDDNRVAKRQCNSSNTAYQHQFNNYFSEMVAIRKVAFPMGDGDLEETDIE